MHISIDCLGCTVKDEPAVLYHGSFLANVSLEHVVFFLFVVRVGRFLLSICKKSWEKTNLLSLGFDLLL